MKKRTKPRQPRNHIAISAHFRKAGIMKDKRKEADWRKEIEFPILESVAVKELQDTKIHIDNMLTPEEKGVWCSR